MKCLYCDNEIPKEQAIKMEEVGADPFCDNYCCNMYSKAPMPYDGIKSFNQRKENQL